ncbi:MAG: thiamine pyrophosphate-binding protein [Rhodocyclaceae bacterium]|jgi:acetolactate synthase-1/2/3 large subunit|nr:thiamine pyrophosphate-binding protein [Rhodocyclaceae bacterium]
MKIAVSELIVRFMERLGIAHVFGMPGAHILPVYDCLYDSRIKSVLVKHEQGAAFMASGYARVTGGVAACITTAGPGATNLVTGIASAYADRQPILIITGETPTYIFGKGGLQESSGEGGTIDQTALFKGITRYHKVIERTDYLAQVLNQAARILLAANSGPVLLSFPYNIQKEMVEADLLDNINFSAARRAAASRVASKLLSPTDELAQLIAAARHPVIVAGYGCIRSGAQQAVAELSDRLGIPVATSLKGKGVIGEDGELSLGCLGVTSNGQAYRYIVDHADLVIFLGAGFNERTSHMWDAKLLADKQVAQVDNDPAQLEKVFRADLAIHADIHEVLHGVLEYVEQHGANRKNLDNLARLRQMTGATADTATGSGDSGKQFPLIEHFFKQLAAHFAQDVQIFDDNIIFAQHFLKILPGNHYFPNSGISSLGHAIPAAIGGRFAVSANGNPTSPTFAILGDGGFQMCCMELMTAVNYAIPINAVVLNNASMGLIRKNQQQLYGGRLIDCDFVNPDYQLLAQSFGINHWKVDCVADVDALFARADLAGSINLIEIMLDKNVLPSYLSGR